MSIDIASLSGLNLDWISASATATSSAKAPPECILDVVALAKQLFGGSCKVTVEEDPEIEGLTSLVFDATTTLPVGEIVARRLQWHREVRQLVRESRNFRLCIEVV